MTKPGLSLLERFQLKVGPPDAKGCWPWLGSKSSSGYGAIALTGTGPMVGAHRVALELKLGRPLQPGYQALHAPVVCNNKGCVNPAHLREGTVKENTEDMRLDGTRVGRPPKGSTR